MRLVPALVLVGALCGCSASPQAAPPAPTPTPAATPRPTYAPSTAPAAPPNEPLGLREELLAMQVADQQERTGAGLPPGTRLPPARDHVRAQRLAEIVAAGGWPTVDAVGTDGASAAWLVAQHADHDAAFQEQVVRLMTPLVATGQADPTDLAYLVDRVAVNRGRPQTYGSQIRCRGGAPAPATAIADSEGVDALRAGAGLGTLAAYYAELALMCSDEAAEGQQPAS